jgi:hypothetical protein
MRSYPKSHFRRQTNQPTSRKSTRTPNLNAIVCYKRTVAFSFARISLCVNLHLRRHAVHVVLCPLPWPRCDGFGNDCSSHGRR